MSSVERWIFTVVWNGSVGGFGNVLNVLFFFIFRSGVDFKGVRGVGF